MRFCLNRHLLAFRGLIGLCLLAVGCGQTGSRESAATVPGANSAPSADSESQEVLKPLELPGLHNVIRVTDKLWSGSGPETEEAFQSLKELGIRTIISVDGARPNLDLARKYGMRYVHLPVGYDGIPGEQGRKIALAVHHLPGPIYLHCHHGRHRGPTAAAVAWRSLDRSCRAEQALALLKKAGTDPRYVGLYDAVAKAAPLPEDVLATEPPEFPETTPVPAFVEAMVKLDTHWHHLQGCRKAGWKPPPEHPDVVPRHEALQLMETYQETLRLPDLKDRPPQLRDWINDEVQNAKHLMELLEAVPINPSAVEAAYLRLQDGCKRCHARYRDVPETP
jgi:protein tyrosine phosphatase (PTP) superfamily phosphohydrolase (DUF442 family)